MKKCPHHLLSANMINILAASKPQQFIIKFYWGISLKMPTFVSPKWPYWLFPYTVVTILQNVMLYILIENICRIRCRIYIICCTRSVKLLFFSIWLFKHNKVTCLQLIKSVLDQVWRTEIRCLFTAEAGTLKTQIESPPVLYHSKHNWSNASRFSKVATCLSPPQNFPGFLAMRSFDIRPGDSPKREIEALDCNERNCFLSFAHYSLAPLSLVYVL
jgi:hypothetical protein